MSFHFQHVAVHHQDLADRDLGVGPHAGLVLVCILWQLCHHHYGHASWISCQGQLSLAIIHFSIRGEFAEFKALPFCLANGIQVGIHHGPAILG